MTLKNRFRVIIVSSMIIFTIMSLLIEFYISYPRLLFFEKREAATDLHRGLQAIGREIFHLKNLCRDWSSWNDAYNFMATRNKQFIRENLNYESFVSGNFNLICIINTDLKIIYSDGYNLKTKSKMLPDFFKKNESIKNSGLVNFSDSVSTEEQYRSGLILTEYGIMNISVMPILTSERQGPLRGFMIMGRILDEPTVNKLSEQIAVKFNLINVHDKSSIPEYAQIFDELLLTKEKFIMKYRKADIMLYSLYSDIYKKPAFLFHVDHPRNFRSEIIWIVRTRLLLVLIGFIVLIVTIAIVLEYSVIIPVNILKKQVQSIVMDEYSPDRILKTSDELGMLSRTIDDMAGTINRKTSELEDVNRVLELLTITDPLTSAYNRRIFDDTIRLEWERSARAGENLSLIMCDIDHFKKYNDMYGHQAGDEILIKVADALRKTMRRITDRVYRYGGEEFVIMLNNTGYGGCLHVAEILLQSVRSLKVKHEFSDAADNVTISIGCVSLTPEKGKKFSYLVSLADKALYDAKHKGRNRICSAEVSGDGSVLLKEHQIQG